MATGEMYEYLPTKSADYDALLSISAHGLDEEGGREAIFNISESKMVEGLLLGGDTEFMVTVQWKNLSAIQAQTIMDLYLDPNKGNFGARSLKWEHPTDGHVYVVHLLNPKRVYRVDGFVEITDCQLLVVGKVVDGEGEPIVPYAYSRYWGVSPSATLDDAGILALLSEFSTSKSKSVIYDCTGGRYPYFCYPAAWGLPENVTVFGLAFTDFTVTVQDFTDADDHTASFNVVRFNNLQNGASVSVGWN